MFPFLYVSATFQYITDAGGQFQFQYISVLFSKQMPVDLSRSVRFCRQLAVDNKPFLIRNEFDSPNMFGQVIKVIWDLLALVRTLALNRCQYPNALDNS